MCTEGDVGNKDDSYMIYMVAGIFNYMLARLQLSSIYYYPHRSRKQPSYQNEVFGPRTPTEANRPEHKAGGLLDREDNRAPVDMSKPPCSRQQRGVVEYKTRVLLTTYLLLKPTRADRFLKWNRL